MPATNTAADPIAIAAHTRAIAARDAADTALAAHLKGDKDARFTLINAARTARRCADVEPSAHVVYCAEWAERCVSEANLGASQF